MHTTHCSHVLGGGGGFPSEAIIHHQSVTSTVFPFEYTIIGTMYVHTCTYMHACTCSSVMSLAFWVLVVYQYVHVHVHVCIVV